MPTLRTLVGLALGALLSVTCGPPGPPGGDCRFDPDCPGGVGAFCDKDRDCASNHCCDRDDCGGGMCTYKCDGDIACPAGMVCDGGQCFFGCNSPVDCADGQKCGHKDSVCYWD